MDQEIDVLQLQVKFFKLANWCPASPHETDKHDTDFRPHDIEIEDVQSSLRCMGQWYRTSRGTQGRRDPLGTGPQSPYSVYTHHIYLTINTYQWYIRGDAYKELTGTSVYLWHVGRKSRESIQ